MIRRLSVGYRKTAQSDLGDIFRYLVQAGASPDTALNFVYRIEERCQSIGAVPHGGRSRDDLQNGLRTVPFEHSAIIAYVIENDEVFITNIFYGGRDFETLIGKSDRQD